MPIKFISQEHAKYEAPITHIEPDESSTQIDIEKAIAELTKKGHVVFITGEHADEFEKFTYFKKSPGLRTQALERNSTEVLDDHNLKFFHEIEACRVFNFDSFDGVSYIQDKNLPIYSILLDIDPELSPESHQNQNSISPYLKYSNAFFQKYKNLLNHEQLILHLERELDEYRTDEYFEAHPNPSAQARVKAEKKILTSLLHDLRNPVRSVQSSISHSVDEISSSQAIDTQDDNFHLELKITNPKEFDIHDMIVPSNGARRRPWWKNPIVALNNFINRLSGISQQTIYLEDKQGNIVLTVEQTDNKKIKMYSDHTSLGPSKAIITHINRTSPGIIADQIEVKTSSESLKISVGVELVPCMNKAIHGDTNLKSIYEKLHIKPVPTIAVPIQSSKVKKSLEKFTKSENRLTMNSALQDLNHMFDYIVNIDRTKMPTNSIQSTIARLEKSSEFLFQEFMQLTQEITKIDDYKIRDSALAQLSYIKQEIDIADSVLANIEITVFEVYSVSKHIESTKNRSDYQELLEAFSSDNQFGEMSKQDITRLKNICTDIKEDFSEAIMDSGIGSCGYRPFKAEEPFLKKLNDMTYELDVQIGYHEAFGDP